MGILICFKSKTKKVKALKSLKNLASIKNNKNILQFQQSNTLSKVLNNIIIGLI